MPGDLTTVLAAVTCGTVVTVAEPVTIPLLRRAAAIDVPGHRSSHAVPTPRGGGLPVAAGLLAASVLVGGVMATAFGVTVAAFGAIGLTEDVAGLSAGRRLALQVTCGVLAGLVLVSSLPVPAIALAGLGLLTAVWITGFVNAFNFMDGVNGISGAHALAGGAAYALLGWWLADGFLLAAGATLAVSALAFLPWNAGRARVFLGDVGSYALGAGLAVLAAYAVIVGVPAEAALGPLALYLADTGWTLQRRIRRGERWLEPHRTHTYQRWCDAGWSHQRVTAVTAGLTVVLGLLGAASLTGSAALRVTADLAGAGLLVAYLRSPTPLLRRAALRAARTCQPPGAPRALRPPSDGAWLRCAFCW
jgi:UDP-N-acetylmuramyl pentapeptide phosphotransferase/UDP-N-acetylglucosamine-1-phosphate transferase